MSQLHLKITSCLSCWDLILASIFMKSDVRSGKIRLGFYIMLFKKLALTLFFSQIRLRPVSMETRLERLLAAQNQQ